jgi:hypothetical protein
VWLSSFSRPPLAGAFRFIDEANGVFKDPIK